MGNEVTMKTKLERKSCVAIFATQFIRRHAALLGCAAAAATCALPATAARQLLPGHIPNDVNNASPISSVSAANRLNLVVALPLNNQAELQQLLADLYDPFSTEYHQFLTPQEFTAEFGPTQAQYDAVVSYLEANGVTVTGTTDNRKLIDISGTVGAIDNLFAIDLTEYARADGSTFYAPDREPSVDEGIAASIESIGGLNDADPPHPLYHQADAVARETGSGYAGGLISKDVRAAYNVPSSLNGSGQTLGLFEFGPYSSSDVSTFESQLGLPSVPMTNVLLDGVSGTGTPSVEDTLDIDDMIDYCPNMSKLIVYEGTNDLDILNRIASDNLVSVVSISYGWSTATSEYQSENTIYEQLASQGISVFVASGDSGSWTSSDIVNPADQPNITSVGGTALTTNGASGSWKSETAWTGSGGGVSPTWSIPSYQSGTSGLASTTMRNSPDVAMPADPNASGYAVYVSGGWTVYGGTSAAAPAWAAVTALMDEKRGSRLGFINPAIYSLGRGSSTTYDADMHDITSGSNGAYTAKTGYDLTTGWGSPNVSNLAGYMSGSTITNGVYTLTPACATGSRLDDNGSGTTNGNKIQIYTANGTNAQNWNFALVGGTNQWNMAVNLGPYCLDGGAATSGTPLQLWGCNGTPDQDWVSGPAAQSGYWNFASKQSGLCIDVSGAGSANGTVVQSYTCNGTTAQAWALTAN